MIPENISDTELQKKALEILTKSLGPANTVRFLSMNEQGKQNYTEIKNDLFKNMSAKEVFEEASKFWEKKDRR